MESEKLHWSWRVDFKRKLKQSRYSLWTTTDNDFMKITLIYGYYSSDDYNHMVK